MRELGGYRLEKVLGSGGMGVVHRATPRSGGDPVALKILAAHACAGLARERFRREAEAAAALRHPNVVRVLDLGETPEGDLWLAMELLEGEDLGARLARGPLAADEAVRIGSAAAEGLAAAHAAGIVHRDVKPANVFECVDGTVRLLDFGLAVSIADAEATRLTAASTILGTPGYMAVEQVQGRRDEDPRTDVWGLGATLYHAASGRTPFAASSVMAELVRVVTDEPDELPASVPRWLREIILRALQKDRSARWQSMGELREALAGGLESEGRTASAPTIRAERSGETSGILTLWEEVRILSVLFVEDVGDLGAFEGAVRAHRGVPSALPGRRAAGVFGGQAWQGDEAERAVRAGLQVRAASAAARIGVATGRGVRARPGEVAGAVVEAARAALSPEGVGTDDETRRRIRGGFDLERDRVVAARPGRAVAGVRGLGGADTPLVDREGELSILLSTLRQVVEGPQSAGILLVGPAGIGKSRLLHELHVRLEEMAEPILYLVARGERHRTVQGWHAIAGALRLFLELPEGTAPDRARQTLLERCPSRPCAEFVGEILGATFPETPHLRTARSDPGVMHDRVVMALGDLVEDLTSRHAAVVLAVEDVHWADSPSIELVEVLLRRLEQRPFFAIGTARPELVAQLQEMRRIVLPGLSRQATRAIVRAVIGEDSSADRIHERAAGNPFFAEELAVALRQGRDPRELPTSVEGTVQARLDALPRRQKDLLRRASVLGRRFWMEALAAMGEGEPLSLLLRLQRRELVALEPRGRLAGVSEWRFRHALVQEVAYESLTEEQRVNLHRAAGQWLADRPDAPPMEVARHLEQGGEAAGALPHLLRAVEGAFREGDALLALEASGRALAQPIVRDEAFGLRAMRAEVLYFLGRGDEEACELEALASLASSRAQEILVHERRARYLQQRARYAEASQAVEAGLLLEPDSVALLVEDAFAKAHAGRPVEGFAPARRALELATGADDVVGRARALLALSFCHGTLGDVGAAMPLHHEVLLLYEDAGDPRNATLARMAIGYCSLLVGRYADAISELERSRDLSRAAGNRVGEGFALHNLGLAYARAGDVEAGLAAEIASFELAAATDHTRLGAYASWYRAQILFEAGRVAEAWDVLSDVLHRTEVAKGALACELGALSAAILSALGRRAEARDEAVRALALRDAAGGIGELEADLFLAAHDSGMEGALARGLESLMDRAGRISDPDVRRSFLEAVPAHARLLALARDSGLPGTPESRELLAAWNSRWP
ncbi:MAG: protein kinase [Deltaproteobacteria bacterium]|nr:protein kinase [Deltaproteobacteria bacterium]